MTTATARIVHHVAIKACTGATSGDYFLEEARAALGVWGGVSSSVGIVDDDGNVTISFDPHTANGGAAAVLAWLDGMGVEYEATFSRWIA